MAYQLDKRLNELFVRDLPLNRRKQLCSYLNIEHVLMSDCGLARDYRGIAQQINLSYSEIAQLEKLIDPCGSLLNNEQLSKLTVYDLCELLVNIGRFDILDDLIPSILDELASLKNHQNALNRIPPLIENENTIWYDAYVCYADNDLNFVQHLAEYLESPSIGFRLFIRDRDLLVGNWVYETFARLIETQCRRMIIVLSPDFMQSHDCKFQSLFAAGLAIEKCSRILVPIIYKPCDELPSMLRLMSKIDMSSGCTNSIPEWSLKRLVMSIQEQPNPTVCNKSRPKAIKYSNNDSSSSNMNLSPSHIKSEPMMIPLESIDHCEPSDSKQKPPSTATNISVISESSDQDESAQLINPFITQLSMDHGHNKAQQQSSQRNRSKSWIKSIKKKIKAAR